MDSEEYRDYDEELAVLAYAKQEAEAEQAEIEWDSTDTNN